MYICCIYVIHIYKHKNQITSKSQTKLQERECDCPRKKLEAGEQVPDQEQRLPHQVDVAEPKIGQKPLVESALPLGKRMSNHNESPNKPSYKVETINPSFLSTHMRGLKARSFTYCTIVA